MENIIGKEKYFIHKGTWGNGYEWKIQKVEITGIKINRDGRKFAEFSFACTGYEYPIGYLCATLKSAKTKAVRMILKEKEKQIRQINEIK